MEKPRVLFLCTQNSARSQMAEAFLRVHAGNNFEVYSAGLEPSQLNPLAIKVMNEKGISMEGHYSKPLSVYLGKLHFSYLITVCARAEAKCPIFPGMGTRLAWPFEDPAETQKNQQKQLDKFRQVRDAIEVKIKSWLTELGLSKLKYE